MSLQDYWVFGLKVRSELELPELFADESEAPPDVAITLGAVEGDWEPGLHSDHSSLVLVIPEVARFRIADGKSIVVDAVPDIPERNVRLFLLGSAFGALLHQRGLLPLHANAIEIAGKAVAFMGESGAGKSTLAAWFHDRGHRVLADDVCVVRFASDRLPVTSAGLPRLRLWLDAIEMTGRARHGLQRSFAGGLDKFDVPLDAASMLRSEAALEAVYVLDAGNAFAIDELTGVAAADAIFAHTYRGAYVTATRRHRDHWRSAMALATSTPVFRVTRTMDLANFDEEGRAILHHLTTILA